MSLSLFRKDRADTFVDIDKDVYKCVDETIYSEEYETADKICERIMAKRIECSIESTGNR